VPLLGAAPGQRKGASHDDCRYRDRSDDRLVYQPHLNKVEATDQAKCAHGPLMDKLTIIGTFIGRPVLLHKAAFMARR
jgi:hypothetical protein